MAREQRGGGVNSHDANGEMKVMPLTNPILSTFFQVGQFIGFWGSSGPSHQITFASSSVSLLVLVSSPSSLSLSSPPVPPFSRSRGLDRDLSPLCFLREVARRDAMDIRLLRSPLSSRT